MPYDISIPALARAIVINVEEHGAPNRFKAGELADTAGLHTPLVGIIARRYMPRLNHELGKSGLIVTAYSDGYFSIDGYAPSERAPA